MQPYETMSRTVHNEFFPPKQKLKEYRRKHLLPVEGEEEREKIFSERKRSASTSAINKMKLEKFRETMTTMAQTKSTFR